MPTLEWIGKDKVVNHHLDVPYRVLERQYSYDEAGQHDEDNGSENMIIHGDNLSALKSLLPRYEGRIKCVYIDPPYNTGNEGWVYNDNVNDPRIRKWLGDVVGKEGEDLSRHDKWLCMMYPRLKLLQRLLAEDGVIFISIDEIEYSNLKMICDEIFGVHNFKTRIVWQKRYTRSNNTVDFTTMTESVLVYAKSDQFIVNLLARDDIADSRYTNPDKDPRGPWKGKSFLNPETPERRPSLCYWIENPNTHERSFPKEKAWRVAEPTYNELLKNNKLYWGKDGKNCIPSIKMFLSEARGLTPVDLWDKSYAGSTDDGSRTLENIFDGKKKVFDFPKPPLLIQRVLEHATESNSIILDSFAGSGTTAHAVLNMNKADGGNRKFILIEMMDYADSITAERVKRVIRGYGSGKQAVEGTGGSFSYYELGEPLMNGANLNEIVGVDKIREYVYFTETKCRLDAPKEDEPYLLGVHIGTAYYFYYDRERVTTLNREFLHTVKTRAEGYVMYADLCTLSDAELERFHITFKKIPRDITKL